LGFNWHSFWNFGWIMDHMETRTYSCTLRSASTVVL
jgi:hypothetical protein